MTSPLSGMPGTRDAWKKQMETATGQESLDLGKADKLGLDQATVDKLHKADTDGDGRLSWDEAWKAFDSFDSNGDAGSVDLTKLGKSDKALAFARGLTSLADANKTAAALHSTATFDATKAQTYTVDGRTITFPPDALAKPAVVDKDYLDRPQISFQLADGTDGRLYNDAKDGWVAVVDHQHYKVDLGSAKTLEIKGLLTDSKDGKQVEGHAFALRKDGGAWAVVANDRAESFTLNPDTGTILHNSAPGGTDIQVPAGATRFEKAWIGSGNKTMEYTAHFQDGRQAALRWSGNNKYTVRADGGDWAQLEVPEDRYPYAKLTLQADGTVRAETRPMMAEGSKVDVFGKDGKLIKTIDFSTEGERAKRKAEGAALIEAGSAEGVDLVNRAYKEQIDHGLIVSPHDDLSSGWKDRALATRYGERMGKAITALAASGKVDEAKALQKKVADELSNGHPLGDTDAKRLALDAYAKQVIAAGEPVASALLPELASQVAANKGTEPGHLYLSDGTYDALDTLAQSQLAAGKLDAAKALYGAAANSDTTARRNLDGYKSGDTFVAKTGGGGTLALDDPPDGTAVKAYDGMSTSTASIARTKVAQIELTQRFQKEAAALPGLTLTDAEKAQVPPSPEVMKKYFAAKYDGQMPQKMGELQEELGAYLKVAYAHPRLNVPDDVKAWTSSGLPTLTDGRLAADCFVANRAAAHMLSGVGGLKITGVQNDGHSRLVVTSADGKQGFVQSNEEVAKLEGKSTDSLQSRVETTIAKHSGMQVLYGMPAPIRLGAAFETGAGLTDVDASFDASFAAAEKSLGGISATSTDGKLRAGGTKVRALVKRYESFRTRANEFTKKWVDTPVGQRTDAMKKEKDDLEAELKQLDKDLASVRGQVPSQQVLFIDAQKKNGGIFDLSLGRDFFTTGTAILINGETSFSLGGSSGW